MLFKRRFDKNANAIRSTREYQRPGSGFRDRYNIVRIESRCAGSDQKQILCHQRLSIQHGLGLSQAEHSDIQFTSNDKLSEQDAGFDPRIDKYEWKALTKPDQ